MPRLVGKLVKVIGFDEAISNCSVLNRAIAPKQFVVFCADLLTLSSAVRDDFPEKTPDRLWSRLY
ncbi:MAG TPA: hypothetical protein V6C85_06000 [Allocoleopsis sp.]